MVAWHSQHCHCIAIALHCIDCHKHKYQKMVKKNGKHPECCFAAFAALIAITRISCWHFFEVKHLDGTADHDIGKIYPDNFILLFKQKNRGQFGGRAGGWQWQKLSHTKLSKHETYLAKKKKSKTYLAKKGISCQDVFPQSWPKSRISLFVAIC